MLLGAKEWGASSPSSRLGLRLSLRVFGLLRMGSTVSLFAARSFRFGLLAKPRSCCALFASDAQSRDVQSRDALSHGVLRHAFDEALILSSCFGQATRSLPFAEEILR